MTASGSSSRFCRAICCLLCLVIIALGITAAVLGATFKKPDFNITGVTLGAVSPTSLGWNVQVDAKNNWNNEIFLSTVQVQAYPKGMGADTITSKGEQSNIRMPPNKLINFEIPLTTPINADSTTGIMSVLLQCAGGSTPIQYAIDVWIKLWGMGPFKIPYQFTGSQNAPCPSLPNVQAVVGQLLG
jgi:hypothetical protein